MTTGEAREMFAFNDWANGRMFAALGAIPEPEARAAAVSSYPSALATLSHIVAAEWIWLKRWKGESPAAIPAWSAKPELSDLRARLDEIEGERREFLSALTEADLERECSYRQIDTQAFSYPLRTLLRHLVNHSTYHRGQLATQLRQLGHAPPGTDVTLFLREGR